MKFHLQNGLRKSECHTLRSFAVCDESDPDRLPVLIQFLACTSIY
jgi:hypothetical protein